jgi:hypothetical protein
MPRVPFLRLRKKNFAELYMDRTVPETDAMFLFETFCNYPSGIAEEIITH